MANEKFSDFTLATSLDGSETLAGLQTSDNARIPSSLLPITVKVSLTSAEILALFTTAKVVAAAPGAGKFYRPIGLVTILHYGTVQYSSANSIFLSMGSVGIISTAIFTGSATAIEFKSPSSTSLTGTNDTVNAALKLSVPSANPTAGDGTLDFYITYITVTL